MIDHIDFSLLTKTPEQCRRIFHGRGKVYEGLSHVTVDWLPPVILITVYQEETKPRLQCWADALLAAIPQCASVQVRYRCRPGTPYEVLRGEEINAFFVNENGLYYNIELGRCQNTGLFLDMANGRDWVKSHSRGKRILNLFAYTCGFSVAALAGGANHVVNVDVSKAALRKGRENHRLNKQDLRKVTYEAVDIFKSYSRLKKHGPYDLLICDPPEFQKGRINVTRDYSKIIRRLPAFMNDRGQLLLCLNSPQLDKSFLHELVAQACPSCRLIESLSPPDVFKDVQPERKLKVLVYEYESHG